MKVSKKTEKVKTKWISLFEAEFTDKNGNKNSYEYVSRTRNKKVVTIIARSNRYRRFLFVSQFRIPVNKIVIGFPGGLIDKGETPGTAALRELKEETGYTGIILSVSKEMPKSAGLTSETTFIVECLVDEKAVGETNMEESEEIQSFWMTPRQLLAHAKTLDSKKYQLSSGVGHYVYGYVNARKKLSTIKRISNKDRKI